MKPVLPDILDRYFTAQNAHDIEAMVACFAPDAVVRDEGRDIVGTQAMRAWKIEAGAKEVSEAQVVRALETAHAAIKQIVAGIDELAKEAGQTKVGVQKKEIGHDFYREVEEKVFVPLTEAMRIRGKLENYDRVDQVLDDLVADIPEGEVKRTLEAKSIFKELKEKELRQE